MRQTTGEGLQVEDVPLPLRAAPVAARLTTDAQFEEHRAFLLSSLSRSCEVRDNPPELLDLQGDIGAFLLTLQESQRQLETEAEQSDDKRTVELLVAVVKRLRAIAKQIADGIAWRALGYDRAVLHLLALKPQTGSLERSAAISEMVAASEYLAATGELVILNDLTNFLRYGDFTSVASDKVVIHEVKAGRGASKSGRATRQRQRTDDIIEFLNKGQAATKRGEERLLYLKTKPVDHLRELASLIRESRRIGSASARLSKCLAVEVFDTKQMAVAIASGEHPWESSSNPFGQSADAMSFDSLTLFARNTTNVAPYSIFPLEYEDRLALMTGEIWVVCHYNFKNLVRCLRRRDLNAELPTKEKFEELKDLPRGEVIRREFETALTVSKESSRLELRVPLSAQGELFYEFLDEESFADAIEEELDKVVNNRPGYSHRTFLAEGERWD